VPSPGDPPPDPSLQSPPPDAEAPLDVTDHDARSETAPETSDETPSTGTTDGEPPEDWEPDDAGTWQEAVAAQRERGAVGVPHRVPRTSYHRRSVRSRGRGGPLATMGSKPVKTFRFRHHRWRRRLVRVFLLVLVLGIVGVGAALADAYYHSYKIYAQVKDVEAPLRAAREALAKGELPPGDPLESADEIVATAQDGLGGGFTMKLAGALPFFKRPIVAVKEGVAAADEETKAAHVLQDLVRDVLGDTANTEGGAPFASADQTPIYRDGKVNIPLVEQIAPRLEEAITHLQAADAHLRAIPSIPFINDKIESVRADVLSQSAEAQLLATDALDGAKLLPAFFGADRPKTYFLAMQNNADQRATGGAVLAYAFVTVDDGKLELSGGGSVYDFDNQYGFEGVKFPQAIDWYLKHLPRAFPRLANINYTPDYPVVAEAWRSVLETAAGVKIDGAIALDPVAVQYLMGKRKINVSSYDKTITESNVVSIVENGQYLLPYAQQQAFPAQLIGAAWEIFKDPTPLIRTVRQMNKALQEKHLQLWSTDPEQEALVEKLGWDGGMKADPGDYLYVVDNKMLSNKVDYYTRLSTTYDVVVDEQGNAEATCTVSITNDTPPNLPHAVVGPNAYGVNRAAITVFVPKGASFESSDPKDGPPEHTEADAKAFLRIVSVLPGHTKKITFTYSIPNLIQTTPEGSVYRLTLQHQAITNPMNLTVKVTLPDGTVVAAPDGWTANGSVLTLKTTVLKDFVAEIPF
jgi:Protein of unknown function (DUF4012)